MNRILLSIGFIVFSCCSFASDDEKNLRNLSQLESTLGFENINQNYINLLEICKDSDFGERFAPRLVADLNLIAVFYHNNGQSKRAITVYESSIACARSRKDFEKHLLASMYLALAKANIDASNVEVVDKEIDQCVDILNPKVDDINKMDCAILERAADLLVLNHNSHKAESIYLKITSALETTDKTPTEAQLGIIYVRIKNKLLNLRAQKSGNSRG